VRREKPYRKRDLGLKKKRRKLRAQEK